jgi:hypothetical protein
MGRVKQAREGTMLVREAHALRPIGVVSSILYPCSVTGDPKAQVNALKRLLEAELDRRLRPQFGCWPLLVGVLGVLLGVALLLGKL